MGALVQQHSASVGFATSQTETIAPATAGNALILVVGTNENAGTDNISTPAGWTLLGTFRQGTTDLNLAVFGKIAAGGETNVTVNLSAAQRVQTWIGEYSGYTLTLDGAISTAGTSSFVLAGDTGTVTPSANGRLFIGVVAVKNSAAQTEGGGFTAASVTNELGAASAQKITLGVYYDLNRSTAAREQPTWASPTARFAGLGILLTPSAPPPSDATITVNRSSVVLASSLMEIHSYLVQNTERGLPTGNAQHNQPALDNAIGAMNAICKGVANHTGYPTGSGFQQQDPTPYGGYTVGAQGGGSTLVVVDGTDFPVGGSGSFIAKVFDTRQGTTFTFTGVSGNTLTGCSGLPASIPDGSPVALFNYTNNGFTGGADRPLLFDNNTSYSVKEIFDLYTNSTRRTLVLAGASVWMHGQADMFFPPRPAYFKTWAYTMAEIAFQFAQNGTPITHVDVWVEYKGFANSLPSGAQTGGSGTLQNGVGPVVIPSDAIATSAMNANYPTGANSAGSNGYTMLHYTAMYNAVWDAFKNHPSASVNTIKIMGSHQNFGATTNANDHKYPLGTFDGTLQASGFRNGTVVPNQFDRNKLAYFADYSTGFDALSLDYSIVNYGSPADANEAYVYANYQNVRHLVRQVKSMLANRPGLSAAKRAAALHFIEFYADVNLARVAFQAAGGGFSDLQQGIMEGQYLRCLLEEGVSFAYRWQPMGDGQGTNATTDALWNKHSYHLSTQRAASNTARHPSAIVGEASPPAVPGALLPAYFFAKAFVDNFPVGTTVYLTASDDAPGNIWAVASPAKTLVANGYSTAKNVMVEGAVRGVPAYGFLVVDASSAKQATLTSNGTSGSTFTRARRGAATILSTGTGVSTLTIRRRAGAFMTSTGLAISTFTATKVTATSGELMGAVPI